MALTIAVLFSVPLGVLSAMRRRRSGGTVLSVGAQTLAAVPVVWAGMMLVVVFAVWLGWLPAQGFPRSGWSDPWAAFRSLLLPALTIGIVEGAMLHAFRAQRDAAGRRPGLRAHRRREGPHPRRGAHPPRPAERRALGHHGARPAGRRESSSGAVVIEQLFSLPGIGRMLVADVGARDLPKVQGELLALTAFVLIVGFVVDLVHRVLDPRQREAS